jgi:hypothetical protein
MTSCKVPSFILIMVAILSSTVALATNRGWEDPALGDRVGQGVVFEGRLWLAGRSDSRGESYGGLASLDLANNSRAAHFKQGVVALDSSGNILRVLRKVAPQEFVVSEWRNGTFEDGTKLLKMAKPETPLTLLTNSEQVVVLTDRAVATWHPDAKSWVSKPLLRKLRGSYGPPAAAIVGRGLYAGFDNGEWGGGMQRVDLASGSVKNIERRDDQQLCTGPLNSSCDPVTSMVPDAKSKGCVVASVGLSHLSLRIGRIVRVCGDRVELLKEVLINHDSEWKQSEPIYGLVAAQDGGYWAVTQSRLYRLDSEMKTRNEYEFPKLKKTLGVRLSRDVAGVIVFQSYLGNTDFVTPMIAAELR